MARGQRWNPERLRQLRLALGLSPEQFADRVGGGVSGRSVRRWEAGEFQPAIRNLEAIADAFNYDIGQFFEPAGDEPVTQKRKGRLPKKF